MEVFLWHDGGVRVEKNQVTLKVRETKTVFWSRGGVGAVSGGGIDMTGHDLTWPHGVFLAIFRFWGWIGFQPEIEGFGRFNQATRPKRVANRLAKWLRGTYFRNLLSSIHVRAI